MRHGPPPETVLARELPAFGYKLALRSVMDAGPPNWLYDLLIGTAPMRWFARQVYFHRHNPVPPGNPPQTGAED